MLALSDAVVVALVGTLGTAVPVIVIGILNHRGIRRTERTLDVGNDRSVAETVHQVAATVEVTQAQSHTNAADIEELKGITLGVREDIVEVKERIVDVSDKLDRHLEEGGKP